MALALPPAPDALAASFALTLWTDDPRLAARAEAAGVDRIGVDLERLGKQERQAGLGTWISRHTLRDARRLRAALSEAALFARTNPPHPGSADEVEALLEAGADVLMLPMFRSAEQVERFVGLVAGRARVVLLLETAGALARVDEIADVDGVDEVHVGINDLSLALGLPNRFQVLTSEAMDRIADAVLGVGRRLGVGGIGRVGGGRPLPIPPDLVYAQYARLGATAALLSRAFFDPEPADLAAEVARARGRLADWFAAPPAALEAAREALAAAAERAAAW